MESTSTYSTNNAVMGRQMRLAVLTPKDAIRIQIHIVRQPHLVYFLFRNSSQRTAGRSEGHTLGRRVPVINSDGERGGGVDIGVAMVRAAEAWEDDGHK